MRGLLIVSHNLEDVEALATRALLVRAGFDITTATFEKSKTIKTAFNLVFAADESMKNVDPFAYDFLIIPGGKYVAEIVDQDKNIKELAKIFHKQKKLIAAICAGPRFLGQAGILDGVHFTAFKGTEKDMPKGLYHLEEKALTDKNIVTARGAGAVYEFVYEIISYYHGSKEADRLFAEILY